MADWVKLVYNETPNKSNVKQGYLFEEGEFYRIVGSESESLVRKHNVVSISKKNAKVKGYVQ